LNKMKTWKLDRISGATPQIMDYCRQIYHLYTTVTDREYFRLAPRGGNNPGTYRRFHEKMKEVSARHPDETLMLEYSFYLNGNSKRTRTIVYKNGMDIPAAAQFPPDE